MNKFGNQTDKALELYKISNYKVSLKLIRSILMVKKAALQTNYNLGFFDEDKYLRISDSIEKVRKLSDSELFSYFPLDAFQGGAGTSINMNVNEVLAMMSGDDVDSLNDINKHQSTNDVLPTALRIMMISDLRILEQEIVKLQESLQKKENEFAYVFKAGRTQLQDATITTVGKDFSTWAGAVSRDRWRIFKAVERIKDVNLGGTSIGNGSGAPRKYILQVTRNLAKLTGLPITKAENTIEATSNYDDVVEVMGILKTCAVNLKRIANDLRLLGSGPNAGLGELKLPNMLAGSSIMPGKVNPVVAEAVVQVSEKVFVNEILVSNLAAQSELQLNPYFPMIAFAVEESLTILNNVVPILCDYISLIEVDEKKCAEGANLSGSKISVLLPLYTYKQCESFLIEYNNEKSTDLLEDWLEMKNYITSDQKKVLFSKENLVALGYNSNLF